MNLNFTSLFKSARLKHLSLKHLSLRYSSLKLSSLKNGSHFKKLLGALLLIVFFNGFNSLANAAIEVYEFDSPRQEAQYKALIEEFRCPKCQNQNLAGSDSQISQDLKRKTYELVMAGQTDSQIREYMYERYGDFISYKPPVRPSTWILWYFPPVILVFIIIWWVWRSWNIKSGNQQITESSSSQSNQSETIESNLSSEEKAKINELLNKHTDNSN